MIHHDSTACTKDFRIVKPRRGSEIFENCFILCVVSHFSILSSSEIVGASSLPQNLKFSIFSRVTWISTHYLSSWKQFLGCLFSQTKKCLIQMFSLLRNLTRHQLQGRQYEESSYPVASFLISDFSSLYSTWHSIDYLTWVIRSDLSKLFIACEINTCQRNMFVKFISKCLHSFENSKNGETIDGALRGDRTPVCFKRNYNLVNRFKILARFNVSLMPHSLKCPNSNRRTFRDLLRLK